MNDGCSVIRLRTLVIFHDERNAHVLIAPRTASADRPVRHLSVEQFEQILLPLIDPSAAAEALAEPLEPPL